MILEWILEDQVGEMSFFVDTDALKWACCKVVIPRHCELVKHFHDQNCDFQKDLRLYILENNLPVSRSACEPREDSWIIKLDTRSPNGLNSKLNDYGNLYYSLF